MARQLYLVRHAQAVPSAGADFDRALTVSGEAEAQALGLRLHESGIRPQLVLSSTALRCRQTCDLIVPQLGPELSVRSIDALYNAPVDGLLATLKMVSATVESVLLVGHNPAISELVVYLSDHVFDFLPPGGCAHLLLTVDNWGRLGRSTARFQWVDTPERPYLVG